MVTLLYQRRVLLSHLIHLSNCLIDLLDTAALLNGSGGDFLDQSTQLLNIFNDACNHLAGIAHLAAAFYNLGVRIFNQPLDLVLNEDALLQSIALTGISSGDGVQQPVDRVHS